MNFLNRLNKIEKILDERDPPIKDYPIILVEVGQKKSEVLKAAGRTDADDFLVVEFVRSPKSKPEEPIENLIAELNKV